MKKLIIATLAIASSISADASILISGAFDGGLTGGEPKVVELYVTSDIADLSLYGVGAANNGGGSDGVELILSGSASAGDFIYIVEDDGQGALGDGFSTYFGFTPSIIFDGSFANGGAASINGDDAIELFFDNAGAFAGGETVVDVFGDINQDGSGQPWEYLDGWAYRNDNTGPDGTTFNLSSWSFSGTNVTDGGSTNSELSSPFPIGTFSSVVPEPSTYALIGGLFALTCVGFRLMLRRRK